MIAAEARNRAFIAKLMFDVQFLPDLPRDAQSQLMSELIKNAIYENILETKLQREDENNENANGQ
jgi:hypothetical protein